MRKGKGRRRAREKRIEEEGGEERRGMGRGR